MPNPTNQNTPNNDLRYDPDTFWRKYLDSVKLARATPLREHGDNVLQGIGSDLISMLPIPEDVPAIFHALGHFLDDPANAIGDFVKGSSQQLQDHPVGNLAALLGPEAGLTAYRETMPLAARTYLHNFLPGSPEFTYAKPSDIKPLMDETKDTINRVGSQQMNDMDYIDKIKGLLRDYKEQDILPRNIISQDIPYIEDQLKQISIDQRASAAYRSINTSALNAVSEMVNRDPSINPNNLQPVESGNPAIGKFFVEYGDPYKSGVRPITNIRDDYKWYDFNNPKIISTWDLLKRIPSNFKIDQELGGGEGDFLERLGYGNEPLLNRLQQSRPGYNVNLNIMNPRTPNSMDRLMYLLGGTSQLPKQGE